MKVLVVDDEAPARQRLIDLLEKNPQAGTLLEAANGNIAVEMIRREAPDLVFLDVQMPELDGLQVIETIGTADMPLTVFVTAYNQHAVQAFEANALDYLLKPYSDERWEAAFARATARHHQLGIQEFERGITRMLEARPHVGAYLDRLVVKNSKATRFVRAVDIDWIEGAGVYVNLHVAGKEILYRGALNDLANRLDPQKFVRVHRSCLVNIDSIVELEPLSHGEFAVLLKDGARARVSRTYRTQLENRLGQAL